MPDSRLVIRNMSGIIKCSGEYYSWDFDNEHWFLVHFVPLDKSEVPAEVIENLMDSLTDKGVKHNVRLV